MSSLSYILLFILIILKNCFYVDGINCYQCDSNKDLECSEKFDEDNTRLKSTPCDHVHEAKYCIKATGIYGGIIGTQRMCSSRDYGDFCDYVSRPGDVRDYRSCIYTCSSNDCNIASQIFLSSFAILLIKINVFLFLTKFIKLIL